MSIDRTPAVLILAALISAALAVVSGCARAPEPPAEAESMNEAALTQSAARTYAVRARLVRINTSARPPQLDIEHEAIPDLVGPTGEIEGMHSMVMSFPVAKDVGLDGLAEGDLIEVDLRVDWEADRPAVITAVRDLPSGAEVELD